MFIEVIRPDYYNFGDWNIYGKEIVSEEEKETGERPVQSNGDMHLIQLSNGVKIWVDAATFQNEIIKEVKKEDVPKDFLNVLEGGTSQ